MKKRNKCIAALAAALLTVLPMSHTLTASATTPDDVIAAAYAAGWPDWLVQQAVNMYAGGNYTSAQCDAAIAQIFQYDETVAAQIEAQFGIAPPSSQTTQPAESATENTGSASGSSNENNNSAGTSSGNNESRPSDQEFINMTLEEKKEYLNAMPEEEKQEFVNTMTNSERNSVIKQLSASDKAAIISNFMDVGKEFGITFNIDELSGDNVQISAHDENGNLVNVTSMGVTIDPTGNSYTVPIAAASGLMLLSVGGILFLIRKSSRHR
ncbi:MAG: hypothetical protein ACI4JQ_00945 [Ruminococcus sp.]